ncbi:MAG: hypothetical protein JNL72_04280 [Flavipsychrobacter sp.]|nr:hypothetical protein [Flavipsychrobacter sp.]
MSKWIKALAACFVVMLAVLPACQHKSNLPVPGSNDTTGGGSPDTGICFERDILPIFRSNCAKSGCHDAASHQEGYILDNYNNIMNTGDHDGIIPGNAHESEIYESLVEDDLDKRMPPPPNPALPAAQVELIRRWINEGAQNGTGCATLCDTNSFTFSGAVQPILQQSCVGCHNASLASGGVNLSNHAGTAASVSSGRLLGAIRHQGGFVAMPQGAPKLSDCQIRQVEKWVAAGTLNN